VALSKKQRTVAKTVIWIAALTPALWLAWDFWRGNLSANPIEDITNRTGWWTLTLLVVTLAITPVRRLTGWNDIVRFRRLLGLFAFFYACLHLLTYIVLDQFFAFSTMIEDIAERPFITVGFAAWCILLSLAVTSTRGWIRRLKKKWQSLHRLIYVAAGLGAIHFYWGVKADTLEPLWFISIIALLLVARLPVVRRFAGSLRRRRRSRAPGRRPGLRLRPEHRPHA
jgi:sulfoxide reductase heme-binding subunit YedZ